MPFLEDFPSELLIHTMSYLEGRMRNKKTLLNLCLVSRRFRHVAEPPLYSYFNDGVKNKKSPFLQAESRCRIFLRTILQRPELAQYVKHLTVGPWHTIIENENLGLSQEDFKLFNTAAGKFGLPIFEIWRSQSASWNSEGAEVHLLICSLPRLTSLTLHVPNGPEGHWGAHQMGQTSKHLNSVEVVTPAYPHHHVEFIHRTKSSFLYPLLALHSLHSLTLTGSERHFTDRYFWSSLRKCKTSTIERLCFKSVSLEKRHIQSALNIMPALKSFFYDRGCYDHRRGFVSPQDFVDLLHPFRKQLEELHVHIDKRFVDLPEDEDSWSVSGDSLSISSFEKLKILSMDMCFVADPHALVAILDENALINFLPPDIRTLRIINETKYHLPALRKLEQARRARFSYLEGITTSGGFKMRFASS